MASVRRVILSETLNKITVSDLFAGTMWILILVTYFYMSHEIKKKQVVLDDLKSNCVIEIASLLNQYNELYGQYPNCQNWCDEMSEFCHNDEKANLFNYEKTSIYSVVLNSEIFSEPNITSETVLIFGCNQTGRNLCFNANKKEVFWYITTSGTFCKTEAYLENGVVR